MKPLWTVALQQGKASYSRNSPNKSRWCSSFTKPDITKHLWCPMAPNLGARDSRERQVSAVSSQGGRDTWLCTGPREQGGDSDILQLRTKLSRQQIGKIGKWDREKWNEREFREEKPDTNPKFSGRTKDLRSSRKEEWEHGCCGREPQDEKALPWLCLSWYAWIFWSPWAGHNWDALMDWIEFKHR